MKIKFHILLFTLLLLSGACSPPPAPIQPQPAPTQIPATTPTLSVVPVTSATHTKVPAPTARPVASAAAACFDLLTPGDGSEQPGIGKIDFTWGAMPGAARYLLEMTMPNGTKIEFKAAEPKLVRYAESTSSGGIYQWSVTAYNTSGETLCTSGPFTYSKPDSRVVPACPAPAGCTDWDPVACVCNG
jgi:hypothetical protein